MTNAVNIAQGGTNNVSWRNRIINGDMRIDQRNSGSAVTIDGTNATYSIDRWAGADATDGVFTLQRSTTAPAGYINSLLATVTTADASLAATQRSFIVQYIEGLNCADLGWGTASASTVTLSFWVRSSLTGTFGGSLYNSAEDRSYPFSYTISAANTFEQKTVTIPGDTTGTWLTTNGIGIAVGFNLGTGSTYTGTAGAWAGTRYYASTGATSVIGTLGATFYITGVQLEAGSVASPFELRDYGRELMMCQRYFYKATVFNTSTSAIYLGYYGGTSGVYELNYPVTMRTTPTATISQPTQVQVYYTSGWTNVTILLYAYNQERSIAVYVSSDHSSNKLMQLSGGSTIPTASVSAEL